MDPIIEFAYCTESNPKGLTHSGNEVLYIQCIKKFLQHDFVLEISLVVILKFILSLIIINQYQQLYCL